MRITFHLHQGFDLHRSLSRDPADIITPEQLDLALTEGSQKGLRLGEVLVEMGMVQEDTILPFKCFGRIRQHRRRDLPRLAGAGR